MPAKRNIAPTGAPRNVQDESKRSLPRPKTRRELARRGLRRQQEARERVVKKAVARGEMGLYVTDAMVRQEMSKQAIEFMRGKVGSSPGRKCGLG